MKIRLLKSLNLNLNHQVGNLKNFFPILLQLRDPKNSFILNFNFDDKMKIFEHFEFRTK